MGLSLGIAIAGLLANAFVVLVKLPHWISTVDRPNAEQHGIMRSVLATVSQCLTRQGKYLSARNGQRARRGHAMNGKKYVIQTATGNSSPGS